MKEIDLTRSIPRDAEFLSRDARSADTLLHSAGGFTLSGAEKTDKRYIVGMMEVLEDHSVAMMVRFFLPGAQKERLSIRFGLLPRVKTKVCFDLQWLDNGSIFTNRTPGTLKLVIHGLRTDIREVDRVELGIEEVFHSVRVRFEEFCLTDEKPSVFPLPDVKLVDEFGQWKKADWPGKVHNREELMAVMRKNEGDAGYPFAEWNLWGGDSSRRLRAGTGFFTACKTEDGRWHLADPEGCDYFSLGPCGTRAGEMGRIDSFEKMLDWLPDEDDPAYRDAFSSGVRRRAAYMEADAFRMFNYAHANLYKAYGDAWEEKWKELSYHILMGAGINSQGNFPMLDVCNGQSKLPYVREIRGFPATESLIFRDFPDVLSPEYHEKCITYAKTLEEWKDDPWLIGYFLRNEPEFNFVPGLAIANEVLHNPAKTCCRAGLIGWLRDKYGEIEALNAVWGAQFSSFADLEAPIDDCIGLYPASEPDIRAYSVFLIREYIRVPSLACRAIDKNHLNLGLRWSKADNPVMMAGWEYFDVFSVNCYAFDPTRDMDFIRDAGVDLPILIGEFHCGALDRGLPATGLKAVENQYERGVMWRYFVEKCAAHPYGVGAHWFQYNDQFCLGRFDGENYQIGMVDVCMQPYKELIEAARESSARLYQVKNGEVPPYDRVPKAIPMIGY